VGERTGIGAAEATIVEVLGSLSGPPADDGQHSWQHFWYEGHKYVKCARALLAVEEHIGLAPGHAYEILLDLAQSWKMPVPLVVGYGLIGGRDHRPGPR
jgi:hypothetical protein